jgi:hypothetical protein
MATSDKPVEERVKAIIVEQLVSRKTTAQPRSS